LKVDPGSTASVKARLRVSAYCEACCQSRFCLRLQGAVDGQGNVATRILSRIDVLVAQHSAPRVPTDVDAPGFPLEPAVHHLFDAPYPLSVDIHETEERCRHGTCRIGAPGFVFDPDSAQPQSFDGFGLIAADPTGEVDEAISLADAVRKRLRAPLENPPKFRDDGFAIDQLVGIYVDRGCLDTDGKLTTVPVENQASAAWKLEVAPALVIAKDASAGFDDAQPARAPSKDEEERDEQDFEDPHPQRCSA